jgi:DUF4097 and DUF4098 domain-containing protein YvlB
MFMTQTPPRAVLAVAVLALTAAPLAAQRTTDDRDWCRDGGWNDNRRATFCEVREFTLGARRSLQVDGRTNGGVKVEGWNRNEIVVRARVQATADSDRDARAIASDVRVEAGSMVRADGPDNLDRGQSWSVSYEIMVPHRTDLELEASNGGLSVAGVSGRMDLQTVNGGIALRDVGGAVRGRTSNGGVSVDLAGSRWEGEGLDLETSNGGVRLLVPADYSATLETGTTNGGMQIDFPLTVQGRIGRQIRTELGRGGPTIRVVTTNGGITVRRK